MIDLGNNIHDDDDEDETAAGTGEVPSGLRTESPSVFRKIYKFISVIEPFSHVPFSMISVGALIWISIRPLIRLILCVSCGFTLTKYDLFPVIAARTLGQIILNVTLPSLMFSKMVPAFTPDNASALGPLILVAVLYEVLGVVMAWITKTFFWVPHRFRYGIILAGGWGNVGDIPTSVIMSLTAAAPFASDGSDQALSVAYISPFILVYMMTLFPMGAHHLIAKDFVGPDVENDEIKEQVRERRKLLLYRWPRALLRFRGSGTESDLEIQPHGLTEKEQRLPSSIRPRAHKHVSFLGEPSNTNHQNYEDHDLDVTSTAVPTDGAITPAQSCFTSPDDTIAMDDLEGVNTPKALELESKTTIPTTRQQRRKRVLLKVRALIKSILTPASISMLAAIPIALIPQLKGLFTPTSNANIPNAPDGQPPLAFILDFANFMGAASVPMGLTCLGSALARLNVPWGEWSQLPVGAIFCLAILKMVVSPVVGVLITIGLTKAGLISEEDKVLQFVCMFFSCLPTATTQVYLTQVYSGTGTAEFFSPFLLPQYFIMFFSMTGLTAYSITYLF